MTQERCEGPVNPRIVGPSGHTHNCKDFPSSLAPAFHVTFPAVSDSSLGISVFASLAWVSLLVWGAEGG